MQRTIFGNFTPEILCESIDVDRRPTSNQHTIPAWTPAKLSMQIKRDDIYIHFSLHLKNPSSYPDTQRSIHVDIKCDDITDHVYSINIWTPRPTPSPATMPPKSFSHPYRRSSNASEKDFFDIPDEPCLSVAKRQLRRLRTWAIVATLLLFVMWYRRESPPPPPLPHIHYDEVDWSRFAYTQYATNEVYLCNSVMVFETLEMLGSKAERVLFYPEQWDLIIEDEYDRISELLLMARNKFRVMVIPIKIEGVEGSRGMYHSIERQYSADKRRDWV